jgi:hypothetical protein
MSKPIIVQISICNEETGLVEQVIIKDFSSPYRWEIEKQFRQLSEQVLKIVLPDYEG